MHKLSHILRYDLFYVLLFFVPLALLFLPPASFEKEDCYIVEKFDEQKVILKGKQRILAYYDFPFSFHLHDKVAVTYEVLPIFNETVENTFSKKKYFQSKDIQALVQLSSAKTIRSNQNLFYKLKEKIQCYLFSFDHDYLEAFLLGNSSGISLYDTYQKLGILPVFSVSGVHLRFLIFLFGSKKRQSWWLYFVLLFYLFLTDFRISITRSILYYFLCEMRKYFAWHIKNENLLLLLGSILLFLNPYRIFDIGFQYSFFLSYMILRKKNFLRKRGTFFFSIFCFCCAFPITWYHFYEVNLFSIFYNLFYTPIGILLFLGSILVAFFPFFLSFFNQFIFFIEKITLFLEKIPFDTIILGKPTLFVVFLLIFLLVMSNFRRCCWYLSFFIFFHLFLINTRNPIYEELDVGQGDAQIIYVNRQCIMIDTGGIYMTNSDKNKHYLAKNLIIPHLKSYGIRKIDALFLTHGH